MGFLLQSDSFSLVFGLWTFSEISNFDTPKIRGVFSKNMVFWPKNTVKMLGRYHGERFVRANR